MKFALGSAFALCASLSAAAGEPTLPKEAPRNVLFIYVEDLGYYTSERAVREPHARIAGLSTPHLDALAARSVVFTHAYCGQSVCSPSKGAIYTGLAPHANGIWRNVFNAHPKLGKPENWIPLPDPLTPANDPSNLLVGGVHEDLPTLIERLTSAGVYCALSHKLHVQPARKFPYDVMVEPGDLKGVIERADGAPWFFWSNPGETHAPFWKSVKHKLVDPTDPNSPPKDVDPSAIQMPPWLPDTPASRIDLAQYYSNVRVIDAFVGQLMADLDASGEAEDTLAVFTGDHGIPVQRGKTSVYPAGTHVPLFVSGPGVKGGRTLSAPVSQTDLNPTFLRTLGLRPSRPCHGRTLWPLFSGERDAFDDRPTILTETNNSLTSSPTGGNATAARAVTDGRYYYVRNVVQRAVKIPVEQALHLGSGHGEYGDPGGLYYIDLHDETVRHKRDQPVPYELLRRLVMNDAPPEELYDLGADPWAVANLVDDPTHAGALERMRGQMAAWRKRTKDRDVHPRTIPRRGGGAANTR